MKLNLYRKFSVALLAFVVLGCTGDFEEINTNPNSPLATQPALLLPGIERDMIHAVLGEAWSIGNVVIQHTAKNQFVNEDRYLWGELNTIWNAVYDNMRDINNIVKQAEVSNQPNFRGVALVLRSWMFSLVTDSYGDVPYTQAMNGKEGIFFPEYDPQQKIYEGILNDLKEANTLLAGAININGDVIYGGDVKKWRQLANSLRLRYLMRISDQVDVRAEMQEIVNDPVAYPLFTGNADHAVYSFQANSPDQFPLFTARIGSFNEFRASKALTDKLIALADNRLYIFTRPTPVTEATASTSDDVYVGVPNGLDDVAALEYNGGPEFQSRIGPLFFEQATSPKGIEIAKGVIMTYAELQFILAEAREKEFITTGTAEAYYLNGINASFSFYGLTASPTYLLQSEVAYTGTREEKLEKIGTQKWISLFFQGLEAWFDWRRTGYPKLQPGVDNQNDDRIPVRFIYPLIEQSLNADNRTIAVNRQGPDDINSRVWWDVK
ncbi:SusD/RagB family nutrient-binding outer membrane lipoprotein [Chryseosolibacter indicus]|uniref:RagB/SusD family nutrient uptake outer membrane protein n=1 Tax=Chryseosolibacter indicus TaxID=2782351 RepID=A0ABS5VTC9_9BACT|nr:SusD/RagB family nutrient-binding outer membrane lipoprotein [Chryseosolibacter indicus]MBT1704616.1 RagB/SusD family nutrient uptake outer membrane protein [Chryseosolibacter indicus]